MITYEYPLNERVRTLLRLEDLYERVRFLHAAGTELGDRYRTANHLAARFVRRLMSCGPLAAHTTLRRFYRAGQAEKIRLVAA